MKIKSATVHGFRSSFRDWAGDEADFPRELAEAALAHMEGDATEQALSPFRCFAKATDSNAGLGKLLRAATGKERRGVRKGRHARACLKA